MFAKGSDSFLLDDAGSADGIFEGRRQAALLKTGALQNAILTSANFLDHRHRRKKGSFNHSMSAPSACWVILAAEVCQQN